MMQGRDGRATVNDCPRKLTHHLGTYTLDLDHLYFGYVQLSSLHYLITRQEAFKFSRRRVQGAIPLLLVYSWY